MSALGEDLGSFSQCPAPDPGPHSPGAPGEAVAQTFDWRWPVSTKPGDPARRTRK